MKDLNIIKTNDCRRFSRFLDFEIIKKKRKNMDDIKNWYEKYSYESH